jgi:putative ABC transport system permease protein
MRRNYFKIAGRKSIKHRLIAGWVACPFAYLIMQGWLNNYVYRIPVTAQPFIAAIVILVFITTALISVQITIAALDNPVESLRTE